MSKSQKKGKSNVVPRITTCMASLRKIILTVPRVVNVFLLLISPMALLMLIVAIIMLLDYQGAHHRQRRALEEITLTTTATIASCYEEDRYCYAEFTDVHGRERYGRLDWRYYYPAVAAELATLSRGDTVSVRYANEPYENDIVLAEYYDAFATYRGYLYEMGGIALVSWLILILHPEIMLVALVDDIGAHVDRKWNRILGLEPK